MYRTVRVPVLLRYGTLALLYLWRVWVGWQNENNKNGFLLELIHNVLIATTDRHTPPEGARDHVL
jgi:hypothetical protein